MWFVDIDHWTIKLVYLALKKIQNEHVRLDEETESLKILIIIQLTMSIAVRTTSFAPFVNDRCIILFSYF